ncbi:MAG TPA: DUF1634 domain-containing protein [Chitinophagaceae bacterium]|nr:DUF1634 domain-containing protein [Chitinophagaceae bacterium]
MSTQNKISDGRIEIIMGNLLRWGVLFSSAVILSGGIIYLLHHGNEHPHYGTFFSEPKQFINLREIFINAFAGTGRSIIQLGVLLLIATPIARVVFSIIGFLLEKDVLYIVVTLIVLGVLLYSIIG